MVNTINTIFSMVALILVIGIGFAVFAIAIYNKLIYARNSYKNAFAQIDVQLQRRLDLIPNLVAIAKQYMQHERQTMEAVIAARNGMQSMLNAASKNPGNAKAMLGLVAGEQQLENMLGRLLAVAENYPDLKANETMLQLSEELSNTENRVAFARQAFNDEVMHYNNQRESFPNNIIAGMFKFEGASLLRPPKETAAAMQAAPKIEF